MNTIILAEEAVETAAEETECGIGRRNDRDLVPTMEETSTSSNCNLSSSYEKETLEHLPPSSPPSSIVTLNEAPLVGQRHLKRRTFPVRLFTLLESGHHSDAIAWTPDGKAICIRNKKKLENVLPKYFAHNRLRSFHRQFSNWGFSRLGDSANFPLAPSRRKEVWYHPNFQRGQPQLAFNVIRTAVGRKGKIKERNGQLRLISPHNQRDHMSEASQQFSSRETLFTMPPISRRGPPLNASVAGKERFATTSKDHDLRQQGSSENRMSLEALLEEEDVLSIGEQSVDLL